MGTGRRRGNRAAQLEMTATRRTTPAAAGTSGTATREPPTTDSPGMRLAAGGLGTGPWGRVLAPARYRHPGDVIRLVAAVLVLIVAAVVAVLLPALLRPSDAAISVVGPVTAAGVLTGLVQVTIAAAALVLLAAVLRYRRFRVLATVTGRFAAAAALMAGITYLAGPGGSSLPAGLSRAYLAAHWLSDAAAGILLGTSCALVTALVADQFQRRHNRLQRAARTQCLEGVPPAHRAKDRR
jgi:membrane-associated phospholipid phosphatase